MAKKKTKPDRFELFAAEAAYAESIFRSALGDNEASIQALRRAYEIKPDYPPAILSMGSLEYQLGRKPRGRKLLFSLLSLPQNTPDWVQIVDEAGNFLIDSRDYASGLELYRAAAEKRPDVGVFQQGIGCCAGHEGLHEEALAASRRALELEPTNQKFVNDLGWTLFESGALEEARATLERAVAMDPNDELARENLRICNKKINSRRRMKKKRGS